MMDPEAQSNLRYELRINDMALIHAEKQTLIDCIASLLGLESAKLHEIICLNLVKFLDQYTLPRKLSYIRKDNSIIDDYKKYPQLVNFIKITLEMVSQIFQTKITMFYLNNQGLLTGLIINQKGYQPEIKIGRINNYFFEVRECLSTNSHHSTQQDPSSSSHSYKFYQAFDLQPLPKKIEPKKLQNLLIKSYSHLPTSTLIKKNISLCEQRPFTNPTLPEQEIQLQKSVNITPALNNVPVIKQFDQLSLENVIDEQELVINQKLTQSIKFTTPQQINLTQSLTITKSPLQPPILQPITLHQQATTPTPNPNPIATGNITPQQPQSPQLSDPNNIYYGYYSQHLNQQGHQMMYYPPYIMNSGTTTPGRNQSYGGGFGNVSTASMSPGKNIAAIRRQNSTLQINQNQRYTGRLKFFDQGKNYGFIIMDADDSDIFVHCDDLQKAGINKQRVRTYKQSQGILRFSFKVMSYFGKYRESRKAVDLIILDDGLGMPSLYT